MIKKRVIAIADVHGCYNELKELVEQKIRFNPKTDILVFLGDYIDRGPDSARVVFYVQALKKKFPNAIVLLCGNHEDLAIDSLLNSTDKSMKTTLQHDLWLNQGGKETLSSFGGWDNAKKVLIPFVHSLQFSYETDTHIFVHGGIPAGKTLSTATVDELMWDRGGWWFGEKQLVVGHTPKMTVTQIGNLIQIDTACCYGNLLSGYDTTTGEIFTVGGDQELRVISTKWFEEATPEQKAHFTKQEIWKLGLKDGTPLDLNEFRFSKVEPEEWEDILSEDDKMELGIT